VGDTGKGHQKGSIERRPRKSAGGRLRGGAEKKEKPKWLLAQTGGGKRTSERTKAKGKEEDHERRGRESGSY